VPGRARVLVTLIFSSNFEPCESAPIKEAMQLMLTRKLWFHLGTDSGSESMACYQGQLA